MTTVTPTRDRADTDRRLEALADDLARRDDEARRRRDARRPALWLTGMTLGAVLLALLATAVVVAPLL